MLTETRAGRQHLATVWGLTSRHRAPWKWVPPPGVIGERGTTVRLRLKNPLSPLVDPGFVEACLRRHFQPLLHPALAEMVAAHYPRGVRFVVNGRRLEPETWEAPEKAPVAVRLARKRKPAASGYLVRDPLPLPEERRGIAVSTFGKVIKRGWDWLGITAGAPDRIGGLVEAPALAQALTLNKGRLHPRGSPGRRAMDQNPTPNPAKDKGDNPHSNKGGECRGLTRAEQVASAQGKNKGLQTAAEHAAEEAQGACK